MIVLYEFTKPEQDIFDFIKHQLNFDLSHYIVNTAGPKKKDFFTVDWSEVPDLVKVNIERLANQYKKFRLEKNGGLGMAIMFGKYL